jgi:hypothetical protein
VEVYYEPQGGGGGGFRVPGGIMFEQVAPDDTPCDCREQQGEEGCEQVDSSTSIAIKLTKLLTGEWLQ